ncbi:TSUP family transporter [Candidatus Marinimicrobia bacterium]|nr:TSUP family transporter [Candidatus Neomarinimicrobiota bacterium]
METDILLTIIFTSAVQSLFGTGVLMLGTPILLILGYDFQNALLILLPTSILINFFQLNGNLEKIDKRFYIKLLFLSIPPISFFLYFNNSFSINLNLFTGIFLIIISLKTKISLIERMIEKFIQNENLFLVIMGIIHGITNLGGALLSIIIFSKRLSKNSKRSTIAICYLTFAVFQLSTLTVLLGNYNYFNCTNLIYWIIGLIIFFFVENFLFIKVDDKSYTFYSNFFIFILGLTLILK